MSGAVVITGAASGIGLACAERLAAGGWRVGLLDRDERALEEARARLAPGCVVHARRLDVTDEPAAKAALGAMTEALGGLDGLVNSAGIAADLPTLDTPVDLFRRIFEVNVVGTFIVARAAALLMKNTGGGSIVNLASIAGLRGSRGRAAYGSSKGAVVTLTQTMAVDLARYGIRVNAVAPGPVDTPMVAALHSPGTRAAFARHVPMRRYAAPGEIAGAVQFLLDPSLSSFVTGEIIAVDGGFRGAGVLDEA